MKLTSAAPLALRERELNPSSCTGGEYRSFLHAYQIASDAALQKHRAQRNVAYGPKLSQRLDFFPATARTTTAHTATAPTSEAALPPLLVFIHGGYWQELSKDSALFAAQDCVPAGIAFAALDYTLAPHASLLEIVLECRLALRWLDAHAADLGFNRQRVVVAGSSAGAHLAAMCGLRGWRADADLPPGLPQAVVLVSGVFELEPLIGTSIDQALRLSQETAALVSPSLQNLAGFPRALVCWGENETQTFKQQSRDMAARIDAHHAAHGEHAAPTPVFEVPARNHFDVIMDLAKRHTALGEATLSLFASPAN